MALNHPHSPSTSAGTPTRTITIHRTPSSSGAKSGASTHASTGTSRGTSGSTSSSSTSPGSSTSAANAKLPLVVLNNTTTPNLALDATNQFRSGGWTVTSYGNYSNDILSTCAYYDPTVPGAEAAAQALMQQFSFIKRTVEKFAGLPAGPIVVVLTTDYTG